MFIIFLLLTILLKSQTVLYTPRSHIASTTPSHYICTSSLCLIGQTAAAHELLCAASHMCCWCVYIKDECQGSNTNIQLCFFFLTKIHCISWCYWIIIIFKKSGRNRNCWVQCDRDRAARFQFFLSNQNVWTFETSAIAGCCGIFSSIMYDDPRLRKKRSMMKVEVIQNCGQKNKYDRFSDISDFF